MEALAIMAGLLWWVIPIGIIVLIVRAIANRGHKDQKHKKPVTYRDLLMALIALGAGFAGLAAIYYVPPAIFGASADNANFAARLVAGVALLVLGMQLKHFTGIFLMIMGILSFFLSAPFIFDELGSAGALLAVAVAFGVLVAFAVRLSKKAKQHG